MRSVPVCLCIGTQKRMVPKRSSDLTFFKRSRRALSSRSACARSLGVKLLRLAILASISARCAAQTSRVSGYPIVPSMARTRTSKYLALSHGRIDALAEQRHPRISLLGVSSLKQQLWRSIASRTQDLEFAFAERIHPHDL